MGDNSLYDILRDIVFNFSLVNSSYKPLPHELGSQNLLNELGLNHETLPPVLEELKARFDGRDVNVIPSLGIDTVLKLNVRDLIKAIQKNIVASVTNPIVVYVDDEEENVFIFKRYFGKNFRLHTFTDPEDALAFVRKESAVRLVITDETMPGLTGNALCNAIRRFKPYLKFILLTGNPAGDENLMYNSLRNGRFHDFINKPLNLEEKGAEYVSMIRELIENEPSLEAA